MKNLRIEYDGRTLWDGPVDELVWTDSDNTVTIKGTLKRAGGNGLLDLLAGGRRQQTEQIVANRRAGLNAEKTAPVDDYVDLDHIG